MASVAGYIGTIPEIVPDVSSSFPPESTEPPFPELSSGSSVGHDPARFTGRAATAHLLVSWTMTVHFKQHGHDHRAEDRSAQDSHHHQVALTITPGSVYGVAGPPFVQGVCCQNGSKVPQPGHKCRGSGNSNFSMPMLEDLRGPCHTDGNSRSQPWAYRQAF